MNTFQNGVTKWMMECFSLAVCRNKQERCDRFLEEALELMQALDYPKERVASMVEYVFSRPVGDVPQEVGGVMVTLAALCTTAGVRMAEEAERELDRICQPEIMKKIQAKQASKPRSVSMQS